MPAPAASVTLTEVGFALDLELAWRFLRRRTGLLLRGTALAALAGVALSVAALVITLALMEGYTTAISTALQRGNAHLVGFAPEPMSLPEADGLASTLAAVPGVRTARPVTYLSGLVGDPSEPTRPRPVVVKAVSSPPEFAGVEEWPRTSTGVAPAVVGTRLAESIGVATGDGLVVRLPPERGSLVLPTLRLEVAGTFRLAFTEFDASWMVAPLEKVLQAAPGTSVAAIELVTEDPLAVDAVREAVTDAAPALLFTDWREMNRSLFAALRWQTLSLFVVLSLVVAVASFQVSSALVVLAIDKRRTAGMMQALGATPARIRRILLLVGLILGGAGVAAGMALGAVASWVLSVGRVVRFPPGLASVYMVDSIPFLVRSWHLAAVGGVCLLLVVVASLWPAWRTSKLEPVAALRAV